MPFPACTNISILLRMLELTVDLLLNTVLRSFGFPQKAPRSVYGRLYGSFGLETKRCTRHE